MEPSVINTAFYPKPRYLESLPRQPRMQETEPRQPRTQEKRLRQPRMQETRPRQPRTQKTTPHQPQKKNIAPRQRRQQQTFVTEAKINIYISAQERLIILTIYINFSKLLQLETEFGKLLVKEKN